jgi:signal transduction histidine kinase
MEIILNIFLLILCLLAVAAAVYFFKKFKNQRNLYKILAEQHQVLLAEYKILQDAQEQLTNSERYLKDVNGTKDKFFSIIAHDLKSPLNTIVGFLQLLNDHVEAFSLEELKHFAGSMNKSVKNLLSLLDNLLQWSRSQTGTIEYNPTNIHLKELINDNLNLLNGHAQSKGITLENHVPDQLFIKADMNMLQVVFRNLLSNAVKFTRKGGQVFVETETTDQSIRIAVKDNGVGMSTEKLSKLFNIDSQQVSNGTAQEKGNGLGLLLCKEFVEKNKGKITVESYPGKGTSFIVSLPLN